MLGRNCVCSEYSVTCVPDDDWFTDHSLEDDFRVYVFSLGV